MDLEIAVENSGLGLWKAADEVFTKNTTAAVLGAHDGINVEQDHNISADEHEIRFARGNLSSNRDSVVVAVDIFAEKYRTKYAKAVEFLTNGRETMVPYMTYPPNIEIFCEISIPSKAYLQ